MILRKSGVVPQAARVEYPPIASSGRTGMEFQQFALPDDGPPRPRGSADLNAISGPASDNVPKHRKGHRSRRSFRL